MKTFIYLLVLLCLTQTGWSLNGNVEVFKEPPQTAPNWSVSQPKIYVALGLLNPQQQERYALEAKKLINVEVLKYATGQTIIDALKKPNTVGLIIVSHTYQTSKTKSSVLLLADGQPLPNEIISAATPALRFIAFLGCHGPNILKQYQVAYETKRLAGEQKVFYTTDNYLSTGELAKDGVKNALKQMTTEIQNDDYSQGVNPTIQNYALTVNVKDVVGIIEPRFVYVNGHIVGVLGGSRFEGKTLKSSEFQNTDLGFQNLTYNVPLSALRESRCQKVEIRSAELTTGTPADDYQVDQVTLETSAEVKEAQGLWHLGDNQAPWSGPAPQPRKLSPAEKEYIKKVYAGWPDDELNPHQKEIIFDYLKKEISYREWKDLDPAHWQKLTARYLSLCL